MNMRKCVCGGLLKSDRRLCDKCVLLYGLDREKWEPWLKAWMTDYQAELEQDRGVQIVSYEAYMDALECDEAPEKPLRKLNGCREQTHLYQERSNY